jgi:hypothetical protein
VLSSKEYVLEHHRHWGMNIPLGGHGRESLLGETISANGEHGHVYFYYMSGAEGRNGGVLIGVEGSEYGKCKLFKTVLFIQNRGSGWS